MVDVRQKTTGRHSWPAPETDLNQVQKLEALGRLAGGIAHDINNVLASIMGVASSMKMDLEQGERAMQMEDVNDILSACRRGREMTLSLLGFARKGDVFKKPLSLLAETLEVKKFLDRVAGKMVRIVVECPTDLPQVEGDPSGIKNALMNLCMNGIDAMEGQGVLTLRLSRVEEKDETTGFPEGVYVQLEVIDTGEGMDLSTRRRVFEPFFTTKPPGKGTGLGLSRVWGIVREHDGTVDVISHPGHGTTMRVRLPALGVEMEDPGIKGSSPPVYAGFARILLIDDEAMIRKAGRRLLSKIGYHVVEAENGKDGLDYLLQHGDEVDLVLLDMIMPVMDGPDTFSRMRERFPGLPVVLCSGYSRNDAVGRLLQEPRVGFVQKPFSIGELSIQIARMLERKDENAAQ